jgi:hypothetical protein
MDIQRNPTGSRPWLRKLGLGMVLAFTLKGLVTTGLLVFAAYTGLKLF